MNEGYYEALLLITLVLVASICGILALYSHTIMPGLKKLNNTTFVASFQAIDRQIINPVFMFQFFAPVILLIGLAYYAYSQQLAEAKYIYIAAASYLVAVVITMAVNVPLNDGIKKVADITSTQSLANARARFNESKWLVFNHIRTVFTFISTIALSWAIKVHM
jgi:uncharacterized membrane protein